jgi:hypothetical protein
VIEYHLGDVRAGLQITAALELEQVTLGAKNDAIIEPLQQALD